MSKLVKQLKICKQCRLELPLKEFRKNFDDSRSDICKDCEEENKPDED